MGTNVVGSRTECHYDRPNQRDNSRRAEKLWVIHAFALDFQHHCVSETRCGTTNTGSGRVNWSVSIAKFVVALRIYISKLIAKFLSIR